MHCCFIKPWYCYMHAWPWSFHSYSEAYLFLIISKLTLNYVIGGPQIVVWRYLHIPDGPDVRTTKTALVWVVLVQYIPRLLRIFPVIKDLKRTAGVFIETAWAGAAYYLLWFMLAGHVSCFLMLCTIKYNFHFSLIRTCNGNEVYLWLHYQWDLTYILNNRLFFNFLAKLVLHTPVETVWLFSYDVSF